jgi:glycosyl transferase family 2
MPCLNEAETIAICVKKASSYLSRSHIRGEILIADNGSTDGSQATAQRLGARVSERGYGAALIAGIEAAKGRFVIMGVCGRAWAAAALQGRATLPCTYHIRPCAARCATDRFIWP